VVLYVKWAFAGTGWHQPETDGVPGDRRSAAPSTVRAHLNYEHLLASDGAPEFSTSIAFIPGHGTAVRPRRLKLFKEKQTRFSLSVHGCDHTAGEFWLAATANGWRGDRASPSSAWRVTGRRPGWRTTRS